MEPNLLTGESVFLRYGKGVAERFDIVAFRDEGGGASIKRVFGLFYERVLIDLSGDVRIDGGYVPDAPGRPGPIAIFDSRLQPVDEHWRHGGSFVDPWTLTEASTPGESEVWTMNGDLVPRGSDLGLLRLQDIVTDGALNAEGVYVHGPNTVHDVVVEFEVKVVSAGGYVRVQLSEENDLFRATIPVYDGETEPTAVVQRLMPRLSDGDSTQVVIGSLPASIAIGEWIQIRMSNIDNRVRLTVGDRTVHADYASNTPRRNPATGRATPFSAGERVKLGGSGVVLAVRNVRVLRDYHITGRGTFGVGRELTLGADEVFVLGDNSRNSRDSRERGAIAVDRVIGTAKAVVRPLRAFRKL